MIKEYIKSVDMTPGTILAGDSVEITVKLIAGKDFKTPGSCIVYDLPATLGFSRPSCYDQEDDGYAEVFCSNPDVKYTKRVFDMEYQRFGNKVNASFKGMAQRMLAITFTDGEMEEGDELVLRWGFIRNGFSVGTKVTTIVPMKEYDSTVHVRYFEDKNRALPDLGRDIKGVKRPVPAVEVPLSFRIAPREPESIRIIRQPEVVKILVLDRFANLCPLDNIYQYVEGDFSGSFNSHGAFEIRNVQTQITSRGLPLTDGPAMNNVYKGMNIYFGDLHTHSATSNDVIEREKMIMTPDRSFQFGRQAAGLDFMAVTDHHQPWDEERNKIGKEKWGELCEAVEKHNREGEFLAFAGFENRCQRGDTTVVFNEPFDYEEIDEPSLTDIRKLWDKFAGRDYITTFHFHNPGNLADNEWFRCSYEGVEPVMEIYSCHGSYENEKVLERHIPEIKVFRIDRNAKYFLQNGYIYGLTCNSDGHKGNPGYNGLTAVFSPSLDRKSIMNAIRSRNCYGTTNARIRLVFTINGELMGAILPQVDNKLFEITLAGEADFKAVDIFRNGELFKRYKPYTKEFSVNLTVEESGPSNWYVRATQVDNHIAYSSPIWFK